MSRVIQREFVLQPGYDTLTPVTLGYAWSSFMNTYAVWQGSSDSITIKRKIQLQSGYYYVLGIVDNYGTVNINGQYNINLYGYGTNLDRTSTSNSTRIYHPGGEMTITISATNTGGPRGVGVTISQEKVTYYNYATGVGEGYNRGYTTFKDTVSVGDLVWSTRSAGTETIARYVATIPFRANVTAHVWGAGGGGGGMDAGTIGGIGAPGSYNTGTVTVAKGSQIEVCIGEGGRGGSSNSGGAPGGRGGYGRLSINGEAQSLNGGAGTAAGPAPYSGGGGGGGGASALLVAGIPVVVAGGGGGGGGAGNDGNGSGQYARRDASTSKTANGTAGSDFRGENGQTKGGDGGGAGGGGGGYPGGQGGAVAGGDASGHSGQCGGNFPANPHSSGSTSTHYKTGFSEGGSRGGGAGQNGRVVLEIVPLAQHSVKISGEWKQVSDSYVKVGGAWKNIDSIFVKIDGQWRNIEGSGNRDLVLAETSGTWGSSVRSYS